MEFHININFPHILETRNLLTRRRNEPAPRCPCLHTQNQPANWAPTYSGAGSLLPRQDCWNLCLALPQMTLTYFSYLVLSSFQTGAAIFVSFIFVFVFLISVHCLTPYRYSLCTCICWIWREPGQETEKQRKRDRQTERLTKTETWLTPWSITTASFCCLKVSQASLCLFPLLTHLIVWFFKDFFFHVDHFFLFVFYWTFF